MPKIISDAQKKIQGTLEKHRLNKKLIPSGVDLSNYTLKERQADYMTDNAFIIFLDTIEYLNRLLLLRPEDLFLVEMYAISLDQLHQVEKKIKHDVGSDLIGTKFSETYFKLKRGLARDTLDIARQIGIGPAVRAKYKIEPDVQSNHQSGPDLE